MSIFNTGRPVPASPVTEGLVTTDAPRRWRWGEADVIPRTTATPTAGPTVGIAIPATVAAADLAATPRWRRWSPFRTARPVTGSPDAVARAGYRKGVRDEQRVAARQRSRGHPVLGLILFACAAAGVGFTALAFEDGSFGAAGGAVDHQIAAWRGDVLGVAGRAVDQSGQAVQNAGKSISDKSRPLTQSGR